MTPKPACVEGTWQAVSGQTGSPPWDMLGARRATYIPRTVLAGRM